MKAHLNIKKSRQFFVILLLFAACSWMTIPALTAETQAFRLPPYETFVLKNGLTVYLMEQHEVPLIYISTVFPAGAMYDNNLFGLATLTAEGLLMGTKNYSKSQIEEELDVLGVVYSSEAGLETAGISMSFLNSQQEKVFPILGELIAEPVFDSSEFKKRKKRLLLELEQAKEIPSQVVGDYFNKFLFNDHVYGNPIEGIQSSVKKIAVDHLKSFYRKNYRPQDSAIAVVGDFELPAMKERIYRLFKDWEAKTSIENKKPEKQSLPSLNQSRVLLVNKEDATETQFIIGSYGIKRSNPEYIGVQVVNTILGDRFTSWLNDELRVNAGLTYGANSRFDAYKSSGTFEINSFTRTATTVQALDLALKVMERLHHQGINEKTLLSAKNYVKGQFPLDYETPGSLADLLTTMFFYKLSDSFINDFHKNVDALTTEKTKEIIAKYFPEKNFLFVLIGKADELREQVKKYGKITEKEIKSDGF